MDTKAAGIVVEARLSPISKDQPSSSLGNTLEEQLAPPWASRSPHSSTPLLEMG